MFPQINIDLQNQIDNITPTETFQKLGKVFLFDFDANEYITKDGKLVECSEIQAVEQYIRLILLTHKDKFNVYKDTDFFCNIEDLIGQKRNMFVIIQLEAEIKEAILKHRYIEDMKNFNVSQVKNNLNVEFTVVLKDESEINISQNL